MDHVLSGVSKNSRAGEVLPVIAAIFFAGTIVFDKYAETEEAAESKELLTIAEALTALVHEQQKERGLSAVYVASEGAIYGDSLTAQYAATDRVFDGAVNEMAAMDFSAFSPVVKLFVDKTIAAQRDLLPQHRAAVQAQTLSPEEATAFYTESNEAILEFFKGTVRDAESTRIVRAIKATLNLIHAKEMSGQEGTAGSIGFTLKAFDESRKYSLALWHGEKMALLERFEMDAAPEQVDALEALLASDVWEDMRRMRANAINSTPNFPSSLFFSVQDYRAGQAAVVDALRAIELDELQGLETLMNEVQAEVRGELTLIVSEAIIVVLAAMLIGFVFAQMLRSNLMRIRDAATDMANGNLEVDLPQRTRNELGDIVEALSTFRDSILEGRKLEAELREQEEARALREREAEAEERQRQDEMREEEQRRAAQERAAELAQREKEQKAAEEISIVVQACANGDYTRRLNTSDKDGIFAELCDGINRIGESANGGLSEVRTALTELSEGNLTHRMEGDFRGVFADIRDAVNVTSDRLEEIIASIKDNSVSVNAASNEIAVATRELSSRTESSAADLENASAAIEELSSSIAGVADSANSANHEADRISAQALDGNKVVESAVEAMQRIRASSNEIAPITKMIDEISFQTNLLALNASVEAARAGPAGRGFAVVAGEVQNLAARSAKAAKDISALIEQNADHIQSGAALVEESGKQLADISNGISDVSAMISSVAASVQQQSSAIADISRTASSLDQTMQENSAMVEQTATATETLRSNADNLSRGVARFRLSEGTGGVAGRTASPSSPISQEDMRRIAERLKSQGVTDVFSMH